MAKRQPKREKGDGSIYQRSSDGLYVAYARVDGKRKYVYDESRTEVAKKLKTLQREIEQGRFVTQSAQDVQTYLAYWLSIHKAKVKQSTIQTYTRQLTMYVYSSIGKVKLQKLTPDRIQKMYTDLADKHLSPNTIHTLHTILKAALKDAVRWKFLAINPCEVVDPPKMQKYHGLALDAQQARKLMQASNGTDMDCFVVLALTLALRRGELLALRWSDIDFETKVLRVDRAVSYLKFADGCKFVESSPKSSNSQRVLLLPQITVDTLKAHRLKQREQRMGAPSWVDKNLVFPGKGGDFFDFNTLHRHFDDLLQSAGLPHVRIHDLRHSCATLLLSMGVPAKVVSEILGHSSVVITMDLYGHVLPEMQQDAMGKINRLFGGM